MNKLINHVQNLYGMGLLKKLKVAVAVSALSASLGTGIPALYESYRYNNGHYEMCKKPQQVYAKNIKALGIVYGTSMGLFGLICGYGLAPDDPKEQEINENDT
ncbi:hypothetical protein KY330_01330 [Candidatus Woesearchaeota archaeon]|nr:hypothetical protein [Candidatus Woesearchaeota archaeon]